jgi:hypothetical protein
MGSNGAHLNNSYMDSKIEIARVYDTVLSSPGMDEMVKID